MSNEVGKVKVLRVFEMIEHDDRVCIYGAFVSVNTNDIFTNDEFLILDVERKIISKDNEFNDKSRTNMTIQSEETIKLDGLELIDDVVAKCEGRFNVSSFMNGAVSKDFKGDKLLNFLTGYLKERLSLFLSDMGLLSRVVYGLLMPMWLILIDILASEHEEPLSVPMETLKSLTHTCIDAILIKEGVDQIMTTTSGGVRKARPTIIEKLCATVESILDYSLAAVWDMSFQVVAELFDKLGEFSSYFLKGALKSLEDIQKFCMIALASCSCIRAGDDFKIEEHDEFVFYVWEDN
ncbi:RRP12-like protein, partial [Tanacetum coccineum]